MNLPYIFTVTVLGLSAVSVQAQNTNAPINTIPEGITTYTLAPTSPHQFLTTYLSAPLANDPMYTGAVSSITAPATIYVGDNPKPWMAGQFSNSPTVTPYYLKFLTGAEAGRVLQVDSNGTDNLTLDTYDNTLESVPLNTANFTVAEGDTFEIFQGDTLGSMFGSNTTGSPLILNPGVQSSADSVSIYSSNLGRFITYYFNNVISASNPAPGSWQQVGASGSFNNTPIRPYQAFLVTRNGGTSGESQLTFTLTGRVAEVNRLIKTSSALIYDSTGFAIDTPLSKLNLGTNWATASVPPPGTLPAPGTADSVSVWNQSLSRFDTYFELTNSAWCKVGSGTNDFSSYAIPAGSSVVFQKRVTQAGANSFLPSQLPYTLNNTTNSTN